METDSARQENFTVQLEGDPDQSTESGSHTMIASTHVTLPVLAITPSERAALQLLADGEGAIKIAGRLGIGENEVDAHLTMLFARMGAADRSDAVTKAFRRGLLRLDGKQRQDEA
jgi:DNA-binding CsgD family transcriptional regulator